MKHFLLLITVFVMTSCNGQKDEKSIRKSPIPLEILNRKFDIEEFKKEAEKEKLNSVIHYKPKQYPPLIYVLEDGTAWYRAKQTFIGDSESIFAESIIPAPPALVKEYYEYYDNGNIKMYLKSTIGGDLALEKIEFDKMSRVTLHETPYEKYEKLKVSIDSLFSILEEKKLYNRYYDYSEEEWRERYLKENKLSKEEFFWQDQKYQADREDIKIRLTYEGVLPVWTAEKYYEQNKFYPRGAKSIIKINANTGEVLEEKLAYKDIVIPKK